MANHFDADDMVRRSIFSSIIGLKGKKPKSSETTESKTWRRIAMESECEDGGRGSQKVESTSTEPTRYRTKMEIYREIVSECAQIESSTREDDTSRSESQSPILQTKENAEEAAVRDGGAAVAAAKSSAINNVISVEEFIKLVMNAVKESGVYTLKLESADSPEQILRRKRVQNNEAAARYRRRQKELREVEELELAILENKNAELREQVERMQLEIDRLKQAVLHPNSQ